MAALMKKKLHFSSSMRLGSRTERVAMVTNPHRNRLLFSALIAIAALASIALQSCRADDLIALSEPPSTSTGSEHDHFLSAHGITLYGTLDAGYIHQSHGVPLSRDFGPGLEYVISKNSHQPINTFAPNGLGQSAIGLEGDIPMMEGFSALFKFESGFDPLSLRLADNLASMVKNNGRSLGDQSTNADGNRAGQIFNGAAYIGVASKDYGTLTFGRQPGLLSENVLKYDPNSGSYAFSVIGYSAVAQGVGASEDARLDSSLKYSYQGETYRLGVQYQFGGKQYQLFIPDGVSGSALEIDLGGDFGPASTDLVLSHKNDAINAAPLSASQLLVNPANSLAATVSDNTSIALMGRYAIGAAQWYAAFERIAFTNPSSPLSPNTTDIGGYSLSVLTQNAYTNHRFLNIYWAGVKYSVSPQLDVTGAYYGYMQNSYAGTGCSDSSNPKCSGALNAVSLVGIYKASPHVSFYCGSMWTRVNDGLASGFLYHSNTNTMLGTRITF
jgi:predicted porin